MEKKGCEDLGCETQDMPWLKILIMSELGKLAHYKAMVPEYNIEAISENPQTQKIVGRIYAIESWIESLDEKERFVVWERLVCSKTWKEVVEEEERIWKKLQKEMMGYLETGLLRMIGLVNETPEIISVFLD